MKKLSVLIAVVLLNIPTITYSQDFRALKAAKASYKSAERNYKKSNFEQASREYYITINTIPANIDSRRYLNMRMESLINIIDIYFNKWVNIENACFFIDTYLSDMNTIRFSGVLRSSQLLDYQRKEQEYVEDFAPKCTNYKKSGKDLEDFRKKFDEEFENE